MATDVQETAPASVADESTAGGSLKSAAAGKKAKPAVVMAGTPAKKKRRKKKNQPGKYSMLVIDTIRELGERGGSSLAKIYNVSKKVSWFDQQNGRTYLRYSIKALLLNDSLIQVKGNGANGSFKLNKKKFEKPASKKNPSKVAKSLVTATKKPKKPSDKKVKAKAIAKNKTPSKSTAAKKKGVKSEKAANKLRPKPAPKAKKPKKTSKPSVPKVPKTKSSRTTRGAK